MLRWVLLAVLVVAISAAAAWISLSVPTPEAESNAVPYAAVPREAAGPLPTLVLDADPTYEFGVMAHMDKGRHSWVVRNSGPGELVLTGTVPSCTCTVVDPKPNQDVKVKPGASYTVRVEWEARGTGRYEKTARVLTNDPHRPEIDFFVRGEVRPAVVVDPPGGIIEARAVGNDRPHEFTALLYSPDRPRMELTAIRSSDPELLKVDYRPLDKQERAALKVEGGYRVRVVVQPTRKLGPFRDEVVVRTDHPRRNEVRLTVAGRVVGPISVTPPEGLRMTDVPGAKGQRKWLTLWVRDQETTRFAVARAPEHLEVSIVPVAGASAAPGRIRAGAGRAYRMTVAVEPGTPPGVIDEPIVLTADHPQVREFRVPVEIRVLGGAE